MSCPQCRALESLFDDKTAARELKSFRRKGPGKTTRILIDALEYEIRNSVEALKAKDVTEITLLDIGGGVGAIQHRLLGAGVNRATNVDASTAYIRAAQEEAERLGHRDRVSYHHGNFVDLVPDIAPATIVTLDRAICCYPDMPALVGLSAVRAVKLYGLVYPRDTWWLKIGMRIINFFSWLMRWEYRFFVHPSEAVETVLHNNGLKAYFQRKTLLWQVAVYAR